MIVIFFSAPKKYEKTFGQPTITSSNRMGVQFSLALCMDYTRSNSKKSARGRRRMTKHQRFEIFPERPLLLLQSENEQPRGNIHPRLKKSPRNYDAICKEAFHLTYTIVAKTTYNMEIRRNLFFLVIK